MDNVMQVYIVNAVEELFEKANIEPKKLYSGSPYVKKLKEFCYENEFSFATGASKMVFTNLVEDYVIKIPFVGNYSSYADEYYSFGIEDHIQKEIDDFNRFIKGSLIEDLFIPNEYVGQVGAIKIYAQEKVDTYEEVGSSEPISDEVYTSAEDCCYWDVCGDSIEAVCIFYVEYGVEEGERILSELGNLEISDIHEGNLGYKNGRLVIFDYAGFMG